MKKIFNLAIVVYFLLYDFIIFAQIGSGPADEDENGENGLEGGDPILAEPATAPINVRLWLLILLVIVYSFVIFKRRQLMKNYK